MRLVERAARAAEEGDAPALARLAERMAATDAVDGRRPPSRALDFLLCDVVASLAPHRGGPAGVDTGGAGGTGDAAWDAALVRRAERDLDPAAARWVRAAVVTVAGVAKGPAGPRASGGVGGAPEAGGAEAVGADAAGLEAEGPVVGGDLVDGLAASDGRPRAELFRDGALALAWLRGYARDLVTRAGQAPSAAGDGEPG